jgi:hypothetical protein
MISRFVENVQLIKKAYTRQETYVTDWLETINCPVYRIDGTLPVEENVDYLVSVLSEEIT